MPPVGPRPKPPWVGSPEDAPHPPGGGTYPWPHVLNGGLGHITWPHKPFGHGEEEPPPGDNGSGGEQPGGEGGHHHPHHYVSPPYGYYDLWSGLGGYYGYYGYYGGWPAPSGVIVDHYYYSPGYPDEGYYPTPYYYAGPAGPATEFSPDYAYCPPDVPADFRDALKDVALSWLTEDTELLARHLSPDRAIEARDDARDYVRTFTRDELIELTAVGFANWETEEFRFTNVDRYETDAAWAEARHVYTDERRVRHAAVIQYHFYRDYGEWYIDDIVLQSDRT